VLSTRRNIFFVRSGGRRAIADRREISGEAVGEVGQAFAPLARRHWPLSTIQLLFK
jgi:hypothetical protein